MILFLALIFKKSTTLLAEDLKILIPLVCKILKKDLFKIIQFFLDPLIRSAQLQYFQITNHTVGGKLKKAPHKSP